MASLAGMLCRSSFSGPSRLVVAGVLDEIQIIHVDRRMLDADQHLAGARCRRFGKVDKLKDDSRFAERFDLQCTHCAPPLSVMAQFDEVAAGERAPGLLQAATRYETAQFDRREAET